MAVAAVFLAALIPSARADEADDPLLGVREGWAWPVVVIQPPGGWDSGVGVSIKYAMRAAEREISVRRDAIRGREVTFMFSDLSDASELPRRIETWRAMKVSVIVSFAGEELNGPLMEICRPRGPSLLLSGGEEAKLRDPDSGRPNRYLFALDLPYYARANALAIAAAELFNKSGMPGMPDKKVAVITDILSGRLAKGAQLSVECLRSEGVDALDLSLAAYRQDQFSPQVIDTMNGGYTVFISWLDAMATLSVWQSAARRDASSVVLYSGDRQKILLDAAGTLLVDKDAPLERNEEGKHDIIVKIRDYFGREVEDPVTAAKAYALGGWVLGAYTASPSADEAAIARELERTKDIPLMGDMLAIDPGTHRPLSRKFGVLRVAGREYESSGSVEVFSAEAAEFEDPREGF
jgi:hypothetical protein